MLNIFLISHLKTTCNNYRVEGNGGALYATGCTTVTFKETSTVTFNNNRAYSNGGAVYTNFSTIIFDGNSINNMTSNGGGGVYFDGNSDVKFEGNCTVVFCNFVITQLIVLVVLYILTFLLSHLKEIQR